jgi:hypothetical protein
MIALADFVQLMEAFLDRSLSPSVFVDRFFALRDTLVQAQDDAIQRNPQVSASLQDLRSMHLMGTISSADYLHHIQAEYERLEGLPLHPRSAAAAVIDQLFVEADAYREPSEGEEEAPALTENDLRDAVAYALRQLRTAE